MVQHWSIFYQKLKYENKTYNVWQYWCEPHVTSVCRIVNSINQFIWSSDVISDVMQYVDTVWIRRNVCTLLTVRST